MQHLTPFDQYLVSERKQLGLLYHFVAGVNALRLMLQSNDIHSNMDGNVSFTRNQSFHFAKRYGRFIRLVVDGDKLSDHYKVRPFVYSQYMEDEYEEAVILPKVYSGNPAFPVGRNHMNNLKRYLLRIEILESGIGENADQIDRIMKEHPDVEFKIIQKIGR